MRRKQDKDIFLKNMYFKMILPCVPWRTTSVWLTIDFFLFQFARPIVKQDPGQMWSLICWKNSQK